MSLFHRPGSGRGYKPGARRTGHVDGHHQERDGHPDEPIEGIEQARPAVTRLRGKEQLAGNHPAADERQQHGRGQAQHTAEAGACDENDAAAMSAATGGSRIAPPTATASATAGGRGTESGPRGHDGVRRRRRGYRLGTPGAFQRDERKADDRTHERNGEDDPHVLLRRPLEMHGDDTGACRSEVPSIGVTVDETGMRRTRGASDSGVPSRFSLCPSTSQNGPLAPVTARSIEVAWLWITRTRGTGGPAGVDTVPVEVRASAVATAIGGQQNTIDVEALGVAGCRAQRVRSGCEREGIRVARAHREVRRPASASLTRPETRNDRARPSTVRRSSTHRLGSSAGAGGDCTPGRPTSAMPTGSAIGS